MGEEDQFCNGEFSGYRDDEQSPFSEWEILLGADEGRQRKGMLVKQATSSRFDADPRDADGPVKFTIMSHQ